MMLSPFRMSSPTVSRGSSRPLSSTIFASTPGIGDADGARFLGHVETAEGGDGRRLGEAVALHDLDVEFLFKHGDEVRGHRRPAGDADLQGIDPVFFRPLVEQHAEEEPGYGGDVGDFFLFDGREDPVEGEAFHQDDAGADPERRQHVGDGAEGVEKGDDGESDVLFIPVGRSSGGAPTGSGGCDG